MVPLDHNATVSQRVEIAPRLMILRVIPDHKKEIGTIHLEEYW